MINTMKIEWSNGGKYLVKSGGIFDWQIKDNNNFYGNKFKYYEAPPSMTEWDAQVSYSQRRS